MNGKIDMTTRIKCITLGCKVNQAETEALAEYGRRNNMMPVGGQQTADICIINTCTVTGKAAMQSRQAVRKALRQNPDAVVVVTGCYAQDDPEALSAIEGVDYVIGASEKHRLFEIIGMTDRKPTTAPVVIHDAIRDQRQFMPMPAPAVGSRTRPFLKIQDGCDAFCSYCIVPYTRGRSRSMPPETVIDGVRDLIAAGAREIVLSGIHMGRYGQDLRPATDLLTLLRLITRIDRGVRFRLSSIEPTEFSDNLLDFIADCPNICSHFHVPLQSGDPDILKKMRRPYSPDFFWNLIHKIHNRLPDAAIGADVLIGFPGETETAFWNTYELIESLPVSYLHVFPYSPRPPAPAASYPDPVHPAVIKARGKHMQTLGRRKKFEFFSRMHHKTLDVLIEKRRNDTDDGVMGLSANYIPVSIRSSGLEVNTRIPCHVTGIDGDRQVTAEAVFYDPACPTDALESSK